MDRRQSAVTSLEPSPASVICLRGILRSACVQRVRHRRRGDVPATQASPEQLVSGPALSSWRKLSTHGNIRQSVHTVWDKRIGGRLIVVTLVSMRAQCLQVSYPVC